jgi:hypothetical protein
MIGFVAVIRHSRRFRGSGQHSASEERPAIKLSKAWTPNDNGPL